MLEILESEKKIKRQIKLPLKKALQIALQSVKIRLGRSVITIGGIFLAIAFLTSTFVNNLITEALLERGTMDVKILLQAAVAEAQARTIWLVSLSLLVCVIGITNAMLTSVTERYREIGTMKCLGALDRFVIELFLLESGFQGLIGAIGGVVLGIIIPLLVNLGRYGGQVLGVLPVYGLLKYAGISLTIGVVLSIVGAIYPAYRAMSMVPADAMRREA